MRRFCFLAVLMVLSPSAHAGGSFSFSIGQLTFGSFMLLLAMIVMTSVASVVSIRHIDATFAELQHLQSLGDVAEEMVATGIRRFAQHHSHGPLYHDTMTRFWVRLVAHAVSNRPEILDFEEFLAAYPLLLDKNTPLRHWSREAMFGAEARAEWREPDRVALPF